MLDREKIKAALRKSGCEYELICLEETDSTNLQCRQAAMAGSRHGLVMTAEKQSAGRGRRGRSWDSASGENLYFSMLLLPEFPQEKASMLTLVAALAAAEAIRGYAPEGAGGCQQPGEGGTAIGQQSVPDVKIKWPNDLVIGGRKICGILTELGWRADGRYFVVIGVGINVNQCSFPEEIAPTASSLCLQTGKVWGREALLAAVLDRFSFYYDSFARCQDLSGLREAYEAILVNRGQAVKVLDPKGEWRGTALGINDAGELLVQRDNGTLEAVYAGEVSVRGIYGYV